MARNGHKMAICGLWFFNFFSYKIEKKQIWENCVLCHWFFLSNKDLNKLCASKKRSEPQFYVKYWCCSCQKKIARNGLKIANSLGCDFHFQSEFRCLTAICRLIFEKILSGCYTQYRLISRGPRCITRFLQWLVYV